MSLQGPTGRWGPGFGPNDVPLNERLGELTGALESLESLESSDLQEFMSRLHRVATALENVTSNKHSDEDTRRSAVTIRAFIYSIDGHLYWAAHHIEKTDACLDTIVGHAFAAHRRSELRREEAIAKRQARIAEAVAGVISLTREQAQAVFEMSHEDGPGFDEALAIAIGAI